jgi:hypothetical protein
VTDVFATIAEEFPVYEKIAPLQAEKKVAPLQAEKVAPLQAEKNSPATGGK